MFHFPSRRRAAARPPWGLQWFEIWLFSAFVLAVAGAVVSEVDAQPPAGIQCGNIQSSAVVITR